MECLNEIKLKATPQTYQIRTTCFEAPNRFRLVRERPSADDARRYRNARSQQALYRAASELWIKGVNMNDAIRIVTEAVVESRHQ